ncbi:MAG TPA: alkyl sulfatase dimerization domain-containing protein [Micromonosporaceae bacterium]|jgi:alkyl sulfatase BDS1-like metallo-beta-lactamase superfamily hydrolase|nr:alkyl sulfatase dimerization domain-containing protein [Micromonosporaceae bacterium]
MGELPFHDRADFADADRGYLRGPAATVIKGQDGRVVWDCEAYSFLSGECPDTANPSLWRQAQLLSRYGLYRVVDGIYQVRGLDLSNMTLVEGDRGVIVIDPLISVETAAAALALYRQERGDRPVTAVIYTHSHADHFGGVRGVLPDGPPDGVPVIAPAGFLEHAVAENVYVGAAMTRRAMYMYASELDPGPAGQLSCGLGLTTSVGRVSLIAPTLDITATGQEETVDGVRMVFQLTPGTEAPAEMNFYFPAHRTLCMAENATHNLHNVLTLRGAVVRDARVWSHYLDEAIALFGADSDALFASHHWPTWGRERIVTFLSQQRDLYAYLHDQTLRLMNQGYTGIEIAEILELPPALESAWHARGYYGSVSHNVKAIYQRYLGWFDGNPAHLWEHPPQAAAERYVEYMGGADAVLDKARGSFDEGDLRWVAQVVNHVVFADPDNTAAKELLAQAYERLGHGAENGTWRNFYLTGAADLRGATQSTPVDTASNDVAGALTVGQLLDSVAVRINGPRAWNETLTIDWRVDGSVHRCTLSNGALIQTGQRATPADLTVTLAKAQLPIVLGTGKLDAVRTEGDPAVLGRLLSLVDGVSHDFAIVTP